MKTRSEFAQIIAQLPLTQAELAIAFLWYYRQTQEFEERTASDLAQDLHDEGFPKPNVTRLKQALRKSGYTIRGKRPETFQLNLTKITTLNDWYNKIIDAKKVSVRGLIIPSEMVAGTRPYLEQLVHQINGAYEYGFYDASATLCRRLMESLIIETYIKENRRGDIQSNGTFYRLEKLINIIEHDSNITLGRNTPKTMKEIKTLGDTAAHDRTYITKQIDIDDFKSRFRSMISELLILAGIQTN